MGSRSSTGKIDGAKPAFTYIRTNINEHDTLRLKMAVFYLDRFNSINTHS